MNDLILITTTTTTTIIIIIIIIIKHYLFLFQWTFFIMATSISLSLPATFSRQLEQSNLWKADHWCEKSVRLNRRTSFPVASG